MGQAGRTLLPSIKLPSTLVPSTKLPSTMRRPTTGPGDVVTLAFAHRGAPGPGRQENTLPAFRDALAAGLTALESDVWLTADDVPVLVHDGARWQDGWWYRIRDLRAADLPSWIPRLTDLYRELGTDYDLSLDLKNPHSAEAVLAVADAAGATDRLWLCAEIPALVRCRALSAEVRLANSTRLNGRFASAVVRQLADEGIDALNLREPEWTPARVEFAHAAGRLAFAWDVQTPAVLRRVVSDGCDAVYSDSIDLLLQART
jgi:glycerophosphoryl diester phosphodiesterase